MRSWWNWQTHHLEGVAPERACEFESRRPHHTYQIREALIFKAFFALTLRDEDRVERRFSAMAENRDPVSGGFHPDPGVCRVELPRALRCSAAGIGVSIGVRFLAGIFPRAIDYGSTFHIQLLLCEEKRLGQNAPAHTSDVVNVALHMLISKGLHSAYPVAARRAARRLRTGSFVVRAFANG